MPETARHPKKRLRKPPKIACPTIVGKGIWQNVPETTASPNFRMV